MTYRSGHVADLRYREQLAVAMCGAVDAMTRCGSAHTYSVYVPATPVPIRRRPFF
jgi:hypothetical protein